MIKWATFREIHLPSLGNVNDYVAHIQRKHADLSETIKLMDKNKLHNVTNKDNWAN